MTQQRRPKGTSSGGQFITSRHAEPDAQPGQFIKMTAPPKTFARGERHTLCYIEGDPYHFELYEDVVLPDGSTKSVPTGVIVPRQSDRPSDTRAYFDQLEHTTTRDTVRRSLTGLRKRYVRWQTGIEEP